MTDNAERIAVDLNPLLANGENGGAAAATLSLLARWSRSVALLALRGWTSGCAATPTEKPALCSRTCSTSSSA